MSVERKKILFLQKRLLFPADSGGKIRTLNVLRHLAKWHDVTYLCNLLPEEQPYLAEMEQLGLEMVTIPWTEAARGSWKFYWSLFTNLFSRYPFNVNKDFDARLRHKARELIDERDFDLLVCDFVQMARNCLGFHAIPKLLFEHNVEAQIFQRHAQSERSWARRTYMWLQWKKMQRFERQAGDDFDTVVAVSERDRSTFQRDYGWQHVHVIDTAVDTDYFVPDQGKEIGGRCVFVGSMDWLPNENGVRFFVSEVWPLIRQNYPEATFQIVGRNPPDSVVALGNQNGVQVTGSVPDIRPFLAAAQVVVIPLLVGGGTRLKAYEAMAMRKPIVSTSLGVEGLAVTDGKNLMIADSALAFAQVVMKLFQDGDLRNQLSRNALGMVQTEYTAVAVAKQFNQICKKTWC